MKLDEKDHQILKLLRDNSRASIRDIAKATGIRPSTVHVRLQKLVTDGVIEKFTLKLNNKALGEDFIVFMLILGKPTKYVGATLLENMIIKEAFGVTGEYDLLLKLKFKDVQQFNDYVIKFRSENPDIQKTLTMVVTAVLKEGV